MTITPAHAGLLAATLAADAEHRAAVRAGFIAAVDRANTTEHTMVPLRYTEAVVIDGDTAQVVEHVTVYDNDRAAVKARAGKVIAVLRGDRLFGGNR